MTPIRCRAISTNGTEFTLTPPHTPKSQQPLRNRLDSAVPKGTDIVILQPGANDLRFFGTKEARTANISAMTGDVASHARVCNMGGIGILFADAQTGCI